MEHDRTRGIESADDELRQKGFEFVGLVEGEASMASIRLHIYCRRLRSGDDPTGSHCVWAIVHQHFSSGAPPSFQMSPKPLSTKDEGMERPREVERHEYKLLEKGFEIVGRVKYELVAGDGWYYIYRLERNGSDPPGLQEGYEWAVIDHVPATDHVPGLTDFPSTTLWPRELRA